MRDFITGALSMAELVIALFFLRFWRKSHDGLFGAFALAFFVLALQRAMLVNYAAESEPIWIYMLRLLGFLIILGAVIRKNLVRPGRVE